MSSDICQKIEELARLYRMRLQEQTGRRVGEMDKDSTAHFLIYRVLGVSEREGKRIDLYQNKGRFLYRYAGGFLEEATRLCIQERYPDAIKAKVPNTCATRPKMYEIDCLVNDLAIEVKWRDATTDGDHITKEHARLHSVRDAGYIPVRVMYYAPQREQAKRIQAALRDMYLGAGGQYHHGENAWRYILDLTGIDLLDILENIAKRHGEID